MAVAASSQAQQQQQNLKQFRAALHSADGKEREIHIPMPSLKQIPGEQGVYQTVDLDHEAEAQGAD